MAKSNAPNRRARKADPNRRTGDDARHTKSKVNLEEKASPTKPQQVHDKNVNRPHSAS